MKKWDEDYFELWSPRRVEEANTVEEIIAIWVANGALIPSLMDDEDVEQAEKEAQELLAEREAERRKKR